MSQPSLFAAGDLEETYTVSQLAELVNRALARATPDGVWVRGEIQGYVRRGAHAYFELVERAEDGAVCSVPVVLFGSVMDRLRPQLRRHRLKVEDGITVRVFGVLDYYAPHGRLRLRMGGIDTLFTVGLLAADRDRLLRRLAAEGLLERQAALALPAAPVRVGVVTRVGSAAWHDLHDELARSGLRFELAVADVRVQGQGAELEVAAAVAALGRRALDVVVLVRGGGSRTDLATFDAEAVARAVAGCPAPVLTGLGHETDRSVADEVAHRALKTPTACAAALVERRREALERLGQRWAVVAATARARLDEADARVVDRGRRVDARAVRTVADAERRLLGAARTVLGRAESATAVAGHRLDDASRRVARAAERAPAAAARDVDGIAARLRAADPAVLLARGWSITRTAEGRVVRDPADAPPGTALRTTTAAGIVASTVDPEEGDL